MKKFYSVLLACGLLLCALFQGGCYLTNSQKMSDVKGTYLLTTYKRTEKHYENIKEDKIVTTVTDEIENRGLVRYLVISGENKGYYVYKDNETPAYTYEIQLNYQADEEDSGKYNYVGYKSLSETDWSNLGITKNSLNEYRPALCSKLFGQEVSQYGYERRWEKVDDATDLSYVQAQLGDMPTYSLEAWEKEGGYFTEISFPTEVAEENTEVPYAYYFFILDTYAMQATTYFAEPNGEPQTIVQPIRLLDGWKEIQIGEKIWKQREYDLDYTCEVAQTEERLGYTLTAYRCIILNAKEEIENRVAEAIEQMQSAENPENAE